MSVISLPTGVSVIQAKKDAKRLANKSEISLPQAQNEVALKHGRADWPTLMNQLKTQGALSVDVKQGFLNKVTIEFRHNKSLNVLVGQSGSGKSLLLLEFASQWLKKGFPVIYLGADVNNAEKIPTQYHGALATRFLISKYPKLFKAIAIRPFDKGISLDDLMLDGAILIADELPHMVSRGVTGITYEQVQRLINNSMHSFLGFQNLEDVKLFTNDLKNITDDNTKVLLLKGADRTVYDNRLFVYDMDFLSSEVKLLEKKRDKFIEFLNVSQNEYQKLRFRLSDHHAL